MLSIASPASSGWHRSLARRRPLLSRTRRIQYDAAAASVVVCARRRNDVTSATAISIDAQPRACRLLCKTVNMTSFIISRRETSRVSQVHSATATSLTRSQFGSDRTCVQYAGYRQFQLGMFTHRQANSPATITSSLNRFAVASSVLCPTASAEAHLSFVTKIRPATPTCRDHQPSQFHHTIRYDTRCYINVRSKANISQHGTDN